MTSRFRRAWKSIALAAFLVAVGTLAFCRAHGRTPANKPSAPTETFGEKTMSLSHAQRAIQHADAASFGSTVLDSDVPVLVDFYADWCGPCRALTPVLEELARENPGTKIVKINVDEAPELAARYGISSIPSLLLFKNGRVAAQHVGLASKSHLKTLVMR